MGHKSIKQRIQEYYPPIWLGCNLSGWLRMLRANRFDMDPLYVPLALGITCATLYNSFWGSLERLLYGRKVARTDIEHHPLFIIGHWRTGTTYLHELLALDKRLAYPTTYECILPNHFLLTERVNLRLFRLGFLKKNRPMDNVPMGWDKPMEDEFGLCNMGVPSPYFKLAFPNNPLPFVEYSDLEGLTERELVRWKQCFTSYLKRLSLKHGGRRLVLKSPTHTFRIRTILELFPDARFVHIVRDPYKVFSSMMNMMRSLTNVQALQKPAFEGLEEDVFDIFTHLYQKLDETASLIRPERFHELRYEDLVREPLGMLSEMYEKLDLGDFGSFRPVLEAHLAQQPQYQTNPYELSDEVRSKITERWGDVIRKYGYAEGAG